MRPRGSQRALERRRRRALELLEQGWRPVDVARKLRVDRRSVRRWRAAWEREGPEGVKARPVPGRPMKLTASQLRRLDRILSRGARAAGFETDEWTCRRVAEVIRERFGVQYHVSHIGRLLRRLGWSRRKPPRRPGLDEEDRTRQWVRTRRPAAGTKRNA